MNDNHQDATTVDIWTVLEKGGEGVKERREEERGKGNKVRSGRNGEDINGKNYPQKNENGWDYKQRNINIEEGEAREPTSANLYNQVLLKVAFIKLDVK